MASAAGASVLLVFPSQVFSMGGQLRPEMAVAHFATIAEATSSWLAQGRHPRRAVEDSMHGRRLQFGDSLSKP